MGGRGSGGGGKGGGGGGASGGMTSEKRAAIVDSVEKAIDKMKAPTLGRASVVETNGLEGIVTKQRNVARGGGTFYDVSVWDGNDKIYNVARDNWGQAKDALKTRMPSMAVRKAGG